VERQGLKIANNTTIETLTGQLQLNSQVSEWTAGRCYTFQRGISCSLRSLRLAATHDMVSIMSAMHSQPER